MNAVAYAVEPGRQGGLGQHAWQVLEACTAALGPLTAFGPPSASAIGTVTTIAPPSGSGSAWPSRLTWRRYLQGAAQLEADRRFGRWLATRIGPGIESCYLFTQIAGEALPELRKRHTKHILDNPNGHIRDFREAVQEEAGRWLSTRYPGHPSLSMVDRVEEEYAAASRIRVASSWAARSLCARGVDPSRISVVPHAVDLGRFSPALGAGARQAETLRVVFVGQLGLGKGFPYLLEALRRLRTERIHVEFVGATGDPWCRRLFKTLSAGLPVSAAPGDPRPAYARADLLVLPTLHDGFGFVVAEAMACGLPVITTDRCGAAEWLREGESGWIVPAGEIDPLAAALEEALRRRSALREMGTVARRQVERFAGESARHALRELVRLHLGTAVSTGAAVESPWPGAIER